MAQFEARYPGTCAVCEGPIEAGDIIENLPGSLQVETEYVHVGCNDDRPWPKPREPVSRPSKFEGTTLDEMGF